MTITPADIFGAYIVDVNRHEDDRGDFYRTFDPAEFARHGLITDWSYHATAGNTRAGTMRGMHYQLPPHGEVKLVRCMRGRIYDVAIDLRRDSPTYRRWQGVELSYENQRQFYIPAGCAHGYVTLEDASDVQYLIRGSYAPDAARGLRYDDGEFDIDWPMQVKVISPRDAAYGPFDPEQHAC